MADHMRNRVYSAESMFLQKHPEAIGTINELQDFASKICKRAWFKKYPGGMRSRVVVPFLTFGPSSNALCLPGRVDPHGEFEIRVKSSASRPTRLDVLHSLTHFLLNQHKWSDDDGNLHDPKFIKLYLEMVERFYNSQKDTAPKKELKEIMLSLNIKTREVSDEFREAARNRWYARQVPDARDDLLASIAELEEWGDGDG